MGQEVPHIHYIILTEMRRGACKAKAKLSWRDGTPEPWQMADSTPLMCAFGSVQFAASCAGLPPAAGALARRGSCRLPAGRLPHTGSRLATGWSLLPPVLGVKAPFGIRIQNLGMRQLRVNGRCGAPTGQPYSIREVVHMHVQVRDYQTQNGPRYSLAVPGPAGGEF
jgi:hypothetical protein